MSHFDPYSPLNFQFFIILSYINLANIMLYSYGTDLTQPRAPLRVLGYHSRVPRTPSSICIIGLELAVMLALERKMVRAVLKIKK